MKPKQNYKEDKAGASYDGCMTPPYGLDPLIPYLEAFNSKYIWEPAYGLGILASELQRRTKANVLSTGLPVNDYFQVDLAVSGIKEYVQVTNPPYSCKVEWLKRAYELGQPFALLLPLETTGSVDAARLFAKYGIQIINSNPRIDFIMPRKEVYGSGAQFPVAWFTWQLGVPERFNHYEIKKPSKKATIQWWEEWKDRHPELYWDWWKEGAFPVGTPVTYKGALGDVVKAVVVSHFIGEKEPYKVHPLNGYMDFRMNGWELTEDKE